MRIGKTLTFEVQLFAEAERAGIKINEFCERALLREIEDRRQINIIDTAKEVACKACNAKFSDICWSKRPDLKGKCISCGAPIIESS